MMWEGTCKMKHIRFKTIVVPLSLAFAGMVMAGLPVLQSVNGYATKSWPSTHGTVSEASVETYPVESSVGTLVEKSAVISYEYSVQDLRYKSSFLSYRHLPSALILHEFHKGDAVTVFFNPSNPAQSVLVPGTDPLYTKALFFIGAILVVIGLVALFFQSTS